MAIRVGIITISTRSARGERPDASGPALADAVSREGWQVVRMTVIPDDLEKISQYLGEPSEIICDFEKFVEMYNDENWSQKIVEILQRRSLTLDDIVKITGISLSKAKNRLKMLENEGEIKSYCFDDNIYYMKS